MKRNTAKTKLIATIISIVSALCLLAVGVFATLTNFQVAIANQLSLKFDAVEGTLYATRLGDVAGTDRTTSKVLSESSTATDWLKVYDGTTTEGVQNDALTSIQEKVDFISNDAIKAKVNAGTTSIAITYYFYYTLPTNAVSNDVVLTAPAVADGNVAVTYSYVKGTGATLPDFTSGTVLTNGETVQVAGGEHLFIKAEAKVDLSKSVKIENANWNFTLNFRISQYTLKGNMLTFNAVSGAETYEVWAKQSTTGGTSLLAQTSAVGDTDATLGTLKKILDKNTTSVDLDSALGGMEAGKCVVTIIPKDTQGTEITDSRVTVSYNVLPKMTITLTFVFNLNIIPENGGTVVGESGVESITQNGQEIAELTVDAGLTFDQIISQYNLILKSPTGGNMNTGYEEFWDQGSTTKVFNENTTIVFEYFEYHEEASTPDPGPDIPPNPTITLTFVFNLNNPEYDGDVVGGNGVNNITQNGQGIGQLTVDAGLTFDQIISQYNLILHSPSGENMNTGYGEFWDLPDPNYIFNENTTITFEFYVFIKKEIVLSFSFIESSSFSAGDGVCRITRGGADISSLTVDAGLTFDQIISQYDLTLKGPSGENMNTGYEEFWDQGADTVFNNNTTITFMYTECLTTDTNIIVYDEKKKKYVNKKLKDITYSDLILVWNFDKGDFDLAKPLWISNTKKATSYTVVEFSDGTSVKFVGPDETKRHRIFNVDTGTFEYIGINTKVGTRTFNSKGEVVTITKLTNREEQVEFANLITYYHFNCFANGILTSCRLNNLYEIKDMKYVKDNRTLASRKDYLGVPDEYYYGLRLSEQQFTDKANTGDTRFSSLHEYVEHLMATAKQK